MKVIIIINNVRMWYLTGINRYSHTSLTTRIVPSVEAKK